MIKYRQRISAVGKRGLTRLLANQTSRGDFWHGEFVDPSGIVTILIEGPTPSFPDGYTRLDAVAAGCLVMRTYDRQFTKRTLPKLCRQLLADTRGMA